MKVLCDQYFAESPYFERYVEEKELLRGRPLLHCLSKAWCYRSDTATTHNSAFSVFCVPSSLFVALVLTIFLRLLRLQRRKWRSCFPR
jgi:hypothetical protein